MQEIKFRAWSPYWKPAFLDGKSEAAMEYFPLSALSGGYTPNADIGVEEVDVVVMQYTGLKDKNGVEIYEGDILENVYSTRSVEYYCGAWWLMEGKLNDKPLYGNHHTREVIGNIYENPELLE